MALLRIFWHFLQPVLNFRWCDNQYCTWSMKIHLKRYQYSRKGLKCNHKWTIKTQNEGKEYRNNLCSHILALTADGCLIDKHVQCYINQYTITENSLKTLPKPQKRAQMQSKAGNKWYDMKKKKLKMTSVCIVWLFLQTVGTFQTVAGEYSMCDNQYMINGNSLQTSLKLEKRA